MLSEVSNSTVDTLSFVYSVELLVAHHKLSTGIIGVNFHGLISITLPLFGKSFSPVRPHLNESMDNQRRTCSN